MDTRRIDRLIVLVLIGIVVVIAALKFLPVASSPTESTSSDPFRAQARNTYDAIQRLEKASGMALPIAKLDAQKHLDLLRSIATTDAESNAVAVFQNYMFAVQMARTDASTKNLSALSGASADVTTILDR